MLPLFLATLAAAAIGVPIANYSGVCLTGASLSDREKIQRGVEALLAQQSFTEIVRSQKPVGGRPQEVQNFVRHIAGKDLIPYANSVEFFAANPDCCRIEWTASKGYAPSWDKRVWGSFAGFVAIQYRARIAEPTGVVRQLPTADIFAITNCGRVWSGV
jgi:hypothetical protein